jgi:hypothetical protein
MVPVWQAAMFTPIGTGDLTVGKGYRSFELDAIGMLLPLDGYHLRNLIVRGALITYEGGPLVPENICFVDCAFKIRSDGHAQNLAAKILADASVTLTIS